MSTGFTQRVLAALATVAVASLALTGCSDTADGEKAELTLAETKSPAQLLRNEAATRVPETVIDEVLKSQDFSSACQTAETDPEGLLRQWDSTVRLAVNADNGSRTKEILDELANSFVEQDWELGQFGGSSILELTSPDSPSVMHLSMVKADEETGEGGVIQITSSGPCVTTGGENSPEVVNLEERG
ncbi:hypothetical protein EYE40_10390 [Glaciihabitans arcticus]|uniref:Lipoprotein n=1 Tax=Glaciihabitans arcticus TaxID=2668039 RepID=A0A4Q9GYA6_9MICO|nr:hypothetical protein [Glaciihabitans arcticus]TBN57763.1 hypothetical protein EYE40_10390 [Glaciihabitans arcticus]